MEPGPPYPVELSEELTAARENLKSRLQEREHVSLTGNSRSRVSH